MTIRNDSEMPAACEVCGRLARLEWHTIEADIGDRRECAHSDGEGMWLCADVCHMTCHRLMSEDGEEGTAARSVLEMVRRLAAVVEGPRRKYTRRKAQ